MADSSYNTSPLIEHTVPVAPTSHSRRNALIVFVALAVGGIGIWEWGSSPTTGHGGKSGHGRPAASVGVIAVQRADVPVLLTAIGTVQPVVNATVRTQIAGVLFQLNFAEGQHVAKGQQLAQVDQRPYLITLQQVQGTLAKDMAAYNSAQVDLRRYQALFQEDSVAKQTLDTQAAQVAQLGGTLAADRAAVNTARLNINYTKLRAPVAGRVGLRQADIGSYVTPGDVNGIVAITQTDPIDVSFALPQNQIAQVQAAAKHGALPVNILDQSGAHVIGHGHFSTFDNAIDATSGTVKAKARVANSDESLFPNEFVNVSVLVDTLANALVVPIIAVRNGPDGSYVYTMSPDKIAHRVAVTTGPSDGARIAILSGLRGNETVIFEGADRIDDGMKLTTAAGHDHTGNGGHGGGHRQGGGQGGQQQAQSTRAAQ